VGVFLKFIILVLISFLFQDNSGSVKIWDIAEGKLIRSCCGETSKISAVYNLCFCQDGKILASCSSDNSIKLWDVQKSSNSGTNTEEPLAVFHTKQTPIMNSRFTSRNVLSIVGAFITE
jgi:WD40 repeat protein